MGKEKKEIKGRFLFTILPSIHKKFVEKTGKRNASSTVEKLIKEYINLKDLEK